MPRQRNNIFGRLVRGVRGQHNQTQHHDPHRDLETHATTTACTSSGSHEVFPISNSAGEEYSGSSSSSSSSTSASEPPIALTMLPTGTTPRRGSSPLFPKNHLENLFPPSSSPSSHHHLPPPYHLSHNHNHHYQVSADESDELDRLAIMLSMQDNAPTTNKAANTSSSRRRGMAPDHNHNTNSNRIPPPTSASMSKQHNPPPPLQLPSSSNNPPPSSSNNNPPPTPHAVLMELQNSIDFLKTKLQQSESHVKALQEQNEKLQSFVDQFLKQQDEQLGHHYRDDNDSPQDGGDPSGENQGNTSAGSDGGAGSATTITDSNTSGPGGLFSGLKLGWPFAGTTTKEPVEEQDAADGDDAASTVSKQTQKTVPIFTKEDAIDKMTSHYQNQVEKLVAEKQSMKKQIHKLLVQNKVQEETMASMELQLVADRQQQQQQQRSYFEKQQRQQYENRGDIHPSAASSSRDAAAMIRPSTSRASNTKNSRRASATDGSIKGHWQQHVEQQQCQKQLPQTVCNQKTFCNVPPSPSTKQQHTSWHSIGNSGNPRSTNWDHQYHHHYRDQEQQQQHRSSSSHNHSRPSGHLGTTVVVSTPRTHSGGMQPPPPHEMMSATPRSIRKTKSNWTNSDYHSSKRRSSSKRNHGGSWDENDRHRHHGQQQKKEKFLL